MRAEPGGGVGVTTVPPDDVAAAERQATPADTADRTATLDRSFARSVAWSGAGRWLTQLVSWPATILIARMLSPSDYGLVVLVRVYTDFISMITEAGLGAAVTIAPDMDERRAGQLHTLSLLLGAVAVVLTCAMAYPIAGLYRRPEMRNVVFALSALFIIEAAGVVPNGLLRREFRYKTIAVADWARTAADLVVELTLAFLGFGYWTLVFGYMAGSTAWQVVVFASRRVRPRRIHYADVRSTLRTMGHMVTQHVSSFVVTSSDVMIGGRLASNAAMGVYSFGAQLATVPNNKVTALVANVTPSLFREVRTNLPLFRRYIVIITLGLSTLVLPAFLGMVVVAEDFTAVVLGPKWEGIVVPLQLLALTAAVQSMFAVLPQVLWATDNGRVVTRFGLMNLAILPPLFLILGRAYGVDGLAAAWLIGTPVVLVLRGREALRVVQLPVREFAASLWPAVSSSLAMVVAVLVVQHFASVTGWPPAARLASSVITGAAGYAGTLLLLHRSRVRQALAMLRTVRR